MTIDDLNTPPPADGRIDLRTWIDAAEITLNHVAAVEIVRKLQQCLEVSAPTAGFCILFQRVPTGVQLAIAADDAPLAADGTQAKPS